MGKRRKKKGPSPPPAPTKDPKVRLNSLSPPNHILSLEAWDKSRYPLMELRKIGGDRDSHVFVAPGEYVMQDGKEPAWPDSCEHPPTWMDPELFAKMVRAKPEIQEILKECYKKNDFAPAKKMSVIMQQIFETEYLPFVLERFADSIPSIAEYLVASYADVLESEKELEASKKVKI